MREQQTGTEWRRPDDAPSFGWLLTSSFNKQAAVNLQHAASQDNKYTGRTPTKAEQS